jgi:threonine/homoserine/homoserine lactone efflux protein
MTCVPENFDSLSWILINLLGPIAAGLGLALLLKAVTRGLILTLVLVVICSVVLYLSGFDVLAIWAAIKNSSGEWQLVLPGRITDSLILPLAIAAVLIGFALGLILDRLILSRCRT